MQRQLREESDYDQLPDDVPVSAHIADAEQSKGFSSHIVSLLRNVNLPAPLMLPGRLCSSRTTLCNMCRRQDDFAKGKVFIGHKQEIAEKRIPDLNIYMKKLLKLPAWILLDEDVRLFFHQTAEDSEQIPRSLRRLRPSTRKIKSQTEKEDLSEKSGAPQAEALYDFTGDNDLELTFKTGDIIYLLKRVNDDWLEGMLNNCTGIFPQSFVRIIKDLSEGTDSKKRLTDAHRFRCVYHDIQCSKIRAEFGNKAITLNYRDLEGDMVRILDDMDVELMVLEAKGRSWIRKPDFAPWELHVTRKDDLSVYNTNP
ncbi:neutrophil cytosol factor 4 [Rhincodon typus]|uniref:neutrophil cytosol factor 4 n=1 Tax=Rhincodon typus TaxID=259920 RepID=UPI00202E8997|nr:neutrophil cytosol factor 4 [Rhincodon typus]